MTHRGIRLGNLFFTDMAHQQFVIGEGATAPPGYDQPVIYEPIPQGMAMREGRGSGTVETDLYALGVTILVLMVGRNPVANLGDKEILRAKITQGSYQALAAGYRLPLQVLEILRSLLNDDPAQRWDMEPLELWLTGQRLSPIQTKPAIQAQRPFPLIRSRIPQYL